MHVALDRQVRVAGRQVLADGEHVDAVRAQVAHHVQNLFVGFAQAHHQAALGRHARVQGLEFFQQIQAEGVVAAGARFLVQARHRFEVVVHHVGRRGFQNLQRAVVAAAEVGRQDLDLRLRRTRARLADAIDKVLAAAVAQIVAVDAGDDHVLQLELRDGARQIDRLVHIQRVGSAVAHVAERAAARALVAHDHECGRAVAKALADVGAARLFAHRHQLVLAQDVLDLVKARAAGAGLDADPVGLLQSRPVVLHLDRDTAQLGAGFLLGCGVVAFGRLRVAHGGSVGADGGRGHAISSFSNRQQALQLRGQFVGGLIP